MAVKRAGIKREYEHATLWNTTLQRNAGVFPQTTASDFLACFWEARLGKYRTPATRTILLRMLPTKALQGLINRCQTFTVALLSLQKWSCIGFSALSCISWYIPFQRNSRLESNPASLWNLLQWAMPYFRAFPHRAHIPKFPLTPPEDSVLCMQRYCETPVCAPLCVCTGLSSTLTTFILPTWGELVDTDPLILLY